MDKPVEDVALIDDTANLLEVFFGKINVRSFVFVRLRQSKQTHHARSIVPHPTSPSHYHASYLCRVFDGVGADVQYIQAVCLRSLAKPSSMDFRVDALHDT